MAFVDLKVFRDKKGEITLAIKGLFDKFSIPTSEKVAGVYSMDLVRELSKRLAPVPEDKLDAGLDYLIAELTKIRSGS